MSRNPLIRIEDILGAIERCQQYSSLLDSTNKILAQMAEDAVERNLQIIGEAANHLGKEITEGHPDIPWPQIRGFRNILVHQYFGVDPKVIREVVDVFLPPLARALKQHL